MSRWFLLLLCVALPCAAQPARASLVTNQVQITGEVEHEATFTVDELRALGRRHGTAEGRGYVGVRLLDVLGAAKIREDARHALRRTYVTAQASDGYTVVFSWGELFNSPLGTGVLVVFDRDGESLRDGEGQIALVSLADARPGIRHVKWLKRISVHRVPDE